MTAVFQRSKQGAVDVVSGDVPLNREYADQLVEVLQQCAAHGQPRVVLDLQNVPLIDSRGLERLLDVQEEFEQRAGSLKLAAPTNLCQEILEVTGVAAHFEVYPNVKNAVGSFI